MKVRDQFQSLIFNRSPEGPAHIVWAWNEAQSTSSSGRCSAYDWLLAAEALLWPCQVSEPLCVCSQGLIYFLVNIKKERSLFNVLTLKTKYGSVWQDSFFFLRKKNTTVWNSDFCSPLEWEQRNLRKRETYNKNLLGRDLENIFIFQAVLKEKLWQAFGLANKVIYTPFCFDISAFNSPHTH